MIDLIERLRRLIDDRCGGGPSGHNYDPELLDVLTEAAAALEEAQEDTARLDFIERTYSGMTNRERYLPVRMGWGKGYNGRTLREACDKYRKQEDRND